MKFVPYFINHNLFFESDSVADFNDLYKGINTNSGNGMIAASLAKILGVENFTGGIRNFFTCREEDVDAAQINSQYTHALLILQDHLGKQWNELPWARMQAILAAIEIPLVVFSLGACGVGKSAKQIADGMSDDARGFYRAVSRQAVSIGIRGHVTAQVLQILGATNHEVVGCPTYFEGGPHRIVAHPQVTTDSRVMGTGLFTSKHINNVSFILQSEKEIIRALIDDAPLAPADGAAFMANSYPGYAQQMLHALDLDRVRFFTDPSLWTEYFDDSVALTAGTRVHGAIVSLNRQRPAIVTAGDVRAEEMCALFKIPHFPGAYLGDDSPAELNAKSNPAELNAAYPGLYASFRTWLLETCGFPVPGEPLRVLNWKCRQVRVYPGAIAAERLRGAFAAGRVTELQHDYQRSQDHDVERQQALQVLENQYADSLSREYEQNEREKLLLQQLATLESNHSGILASFEQLQVREKELSHQMGVLRLKFKDLLARYQSDDRTLIETEQRLAAVNQELAELRQSRSWQLTAPLRRLVGRFSNK